MGAVYSTIGNSCSEGVWVLLCPDHCAAQPCKTRGTKALRMGLGRQDDPGKGQPGLLKVLSQKGKRKN